MHQRNQRNGTSSSSAVAKLQPAFKYSFGTPLIGFLLVTYGAIRILTDCKIDSMYSIYVRQQGVHLAMPPTVRRVNKFESIFLETQILQILIYHYFKDYIIQQASIKSFTLRCVILLSVEVPKKAKQSRESETPRNSN